MHRGVEILAIFTLIFSTETASAQVGAGDPRSSRCTTELARATLAEGSVVDRRVPATPSEIRFEPRGLSLLRPYAPGKVPVVLVNGLWGSPRQWSRMVKDLEADPLVSERFQFLTFGYSTGDPIPYSAYTLRRAIRDLRHRLDPDRSNPAWNRMVLIWALGVRPWALGPGRSGGCPPELPQIRACTSRAPGSSSHEFATRDPSSLRGHGSGHDVPARFRFNGS